MADVNGTVHDYFRNIGYREKKAFSWEVQGFATGRVPIFDGYNHNKRVVGEFSYAEAADVLMKRTNGRYAWYYVISEHSGEGWIAPDDDNFHLMDEYYLDTYLGEKNPRRSSYFEALIKLGEVNESFLAGIVQKDYNPATRDVALQALSEMDTSPETEYEVLQAGKRLSKSYTCFVFSSGGKAMFNILSRSDNEEAFHFMVDAFLEELDYLENCWNFFDDGPADILRDAAKTSEQVRYIRSKLRDEIRRYEIDYKDFERKNNLQYQFRAKFKKDLLDEIMPR